VSVKRNIIANYAGSAVTTLLSVALVPVYLRYLGIEAYALVGLFTVIQIWLALLDFGMTPTLSREMARFTAGTVPVQAIRDLLRSLEILALGVALLIITALVLGADTLANHWLDARTLPPAAIAEAIIIMSLVVTTRFCEALWRSALIGLQQQVWWNGANALLTIFRYGGAALLVAFVSPTTTAFFAWQLLASLLTLAAFGWKLYRCLPAGDRPARFSVAALVDIRRFAAGMIGINLLAVLLTQVDKLMLSKLIPLAEFGHYMLATTLSGLLYALAAPVTQALSPPLVEAATRNDSAAVARLYHGGAQLIAVVVAPIALLLIGFGGDVMLLWTGDAALSAKVAPLLALVTAGTLLNTLMQLPYFTMVAHGWTRLSLVSNIVAAMVLLPALLLVVPRYGAPGAALVWIVLNLGYIVFQVPLLHRRILRGEMARWYFADLALPLLCAGAGLGVMLLLRGQLAPTRWQLLPLLALAWAAVALPALLSAGAVRGRLAPLWARLRGGRSPR
jgi:O-antigen/teichoic acid export membrane protein